jgi:ABC-type transport system involved in cytochrome c biogenesis permease subunit
VERRGGRGLLALGMERMIGAWAYVNLALYVLSFFLYLRYLYGNNRWIGVLATASLAAGVLAHYVALMERSRFTHTVPYDDLYGSMSLFAWLLAVTYLGLEVYHAQRGVGAFVTLLLIVWTSMVMIFAPTSAPSPPARGPLFALHVTLNTLAYAAFGLSFVLSLIYLIQNRVLKARRPGLTFWRFPALDVLERMSRSSVFVGLIALGLGVSFGFVWQHRLSGRFSAADPKIIITLVIFALYIAYLWLAGKAGWRGARAARVCAFNFLLVLFSYTFVNLYFTSFHRYL